MIGTVHTFNVFLPLLSSSKAPTKHAVVITSNAGDPEWTVAAGYFRSSGYALSKAAANMVVAKYACVQEYKEKQIVFLGISPGMIKTIKPSETIGTSLCPLLVLF